MANRTLHELLRDQMGVDTHPNINPLVDNVGATAVKIANNNPNRVGLSIFNLSANSVYIMLDNLVSATRGILLGANGGLVSFVWQYDMELISNEWWAIAPAGASEILVVEVVTQ